MTKVLMQGNEACVKGAIAAGMRFFAGYPITPSTEIAEGSAVELPKVGGKFIQMEDELASMAAVIGASAAGVKSMTATSGPGFSLKQENIGYASEAEIPCVIVDVQRTGPSTGMATSPSQGDVMQARWGTHGDHPIIALSPSSVEETYRLVIRAFNLSEKYMTPVIFLMDEIIGHMREGVEISNDIEVIDRKMPSEDQKENYRPYDCADGELVPALAPMGKGFYYNITGLLHGGDGFPTNDNEVTGRQVLRLMKKIEDNRADICQSESQDMDDAEIAIVCYGGTARSADEAIFQLKEKGIKVGMFRPITIWPFPEEDFLKATKNVKKILVVEHNYGQILLEVQRLAKNLPVEFLGCINGKTISPDEIIAKVEEL
ncbi:MAG: 2-oxoacid:acceptor oxidoreductase subunit alpha [Solobacterium sp.]|nr:2-oxoacid:acceptor oxidoreductase subunit alpha [Solobacterium sp.]